MHLPSFAMQDASVCSFSLLSVYVSGLIRYHEKTQSAVTPKDVRRTASRHTAPSPNAVITVKRLTTKKISSNLNHAVKYVL